jgi:hypothetical protein
MTRIQQETDFASPQPKPSEKLDNVNQLVRELDAAMDRFPEEALRDCQGHRDVVIPALLEVLRETTRLGREGIVRNGNAAMFALFLLTEFRATQAIDAVSEFLRIPGKVVDTLLGDAITEDLPRIVAAFATDRPEILERLISDSQANEYVRTAALEAHKYLVRDGLLQRSEIVSRLRDYLQTLVAEKSVWPATLVVSMLADLKAVEARPDIEQSFHTGVVDEDFISLEFVDGLLAKETAEFDSELTNLEPTFIADTVEEMRGWNWHRDEVWYEDESGTDSESVFDDDLMNWAARRVLRLDEQESNTSDDDLDVSPQHTDTIRYDAPHVGRNDPCPCGSGRKYKKCCLYKISPK